MKHTGFYYHCANGQLDIPKFQSSCVEIAKLGGTNIWVRHLNAGDSGTAARSPMSVVSK